MSLRLTMRRERAACVRVRATKHCARFGAPAAAALLLMVMALALLPSCGGGGSTVVSPPPPPPPPPPPAPPPPLAITTTSLPDAGASAVYAFNLQATGGTTPYRWSVIGGSPPGSMSLTSDGQIHMNPIEIGTFTFTVQVEDSGSPRQATSRDLTYRGFLRLTIQTGGVPMGQLNLPYSAFVVGAGGLAPYVWFLESGSLLPGLTFNQQTAEITGTPTAPGPTSFRIRLTDSASPPQTVTHDYFQEIALPLSITTQSLPNGKVGRPFGGFFGIIIYMGWTGGSGNPLWSISAGTLPPGVSLHPTGYFEGGPTQSGTYTFTIQAQDFSSPPQTATRTYTVSVDDFVVSPNLASVTGGVIGFPFSANLQASGGMPPYSWTAVPGQSSVLYAAGLPPGVALDSVTGTLSGVPTSSGGFSFQAIATDSSVPPLTDSFFFGVTIQALPTITTTSLPDGVVGRFYNQCLVTFGGLFPQTFSTVAGSLPAGLMLQAQSPCITGTPTAPGTYDFTVQMADASVPALTTTSDLRIRTGDVLTLATQSLPDGTRGQPYSATLMVSGGIAPYSWQPTSILPNGLQMDAATGLLAGTLIESSSIGRVEFQVRDSSNPSQSVSGVLLFNIQDQMYIPATRLPAGVVGADYFVRLPVVGANGTAGWSVTSGSLPAGLILDPTTGAIAGRPTTVESRAFTVQFTDGSNPPRSATANLTIDTLSAPGRNDTTATAAKVSYGVFRASISPAEDGMGSLQPDVDVYEMEVVAGTRVKVEILAERLTPPSPMDSVIEIVDSGGTRIVSCIISNVFFPAPCMNDDTVFTLDSELVIYSTGAPSSTNRFYIRVLDWSGDARPDFRYEISITGAN